MSENVSSTAEKSSDSTSNKKSESRLYRPNSQALAQLAIGTCVVIASLLALPDGIALIPNAPDVLSWFLRLLGNWLSAAVLWFVGFLGLMHCVGFLVRGVEIRDSGIKLWQYARPIAWKNVEAIVVEPQIFFSKIFSLKPVAKRLTIFESKKSWRKAGPYNLVPHHLPSFFFSADEFNNLCLDATTSRFGFAPQSADGVFSEAKTLPRLCSVYKAFVWQRILVSILIAFGLVSFLGRKASVNYQYNSGNKAFNAHDYQAAKKRYADAVSMDPTFAAGWNNLAQAEFELGDISSAQRHWSKALFYKPDFVEAKESLAYLELQQRNFGKARDYLNTALNLAPRDSFALTLKADLEFKQGNVRDALSDAHLVIGDPRSARPAKYTAQCVLADAKLFQGRIKEAQKIIQMLPRVTNPMLKNGTNITYRLIVEAKLERALGHLEKAQDLVDQAIRRAPRLADGYIEKAKIAILAKEFGLADTTLDALTDLDPNNPWSYLLRAQLLHQQAQPAGKVEEELVHATSCPNPDAQLLAETAKLYEQLGNNELANKCAYLAIKIEPTNLLAQQVIRDQYQP